MKNYTNATRSLKIPALVLTSIALFSGLGRAQAIDFGPATQISSELDVINGTEVYGYSLTRSQSGTFAVNGVTFTQVGNGGGGGYSTTNFSMTTLTGTNSSQNSGTFGTTSAPFGTLSSSFKNLLSAGDEGQPGKLSFTLNNLVVGDTYSLEIFSNDSRGFTANRLITLSDGGLGGTNVTLNNDTSGSGGLGQYSIGDFTATGTSASFLADTRSSTGLINGFVLDNTTVAAPEPSTYAMVALGVGALLFINRRRALANQA